MGSVVQGKRGKQGDQKRRKKQRSHEPHVIGKNKIKEKPD